MNRRDSEGRKEQLRYIQKSSKSETLNHERPKEQRSMHNQSSNPETLDQKNAEALIIKTQLQKP